MPDNAPAGPHAPMTNIVETGTAVEGPQTAPGSVGMGDEAALDAAGTFEAVPHAELGALGVDAIQFNVPDMSGLTDAGVASFGAPAMLEAVLGNDERVKITSTKQYPWRLNASLLITAADNSQWLGTAWFISPRTLVTAGHCVCIKNSGVEGRDGWVKKIQVMPARNGDVLPFGGMTATEFWTVQGWGNDGQENYDYAAIILPAAFPQDLGFYGFAVVTDDVLLASVANIAGYPSDKDKGTLWYDHKPVGSVKPDKVYYAIDTAGGQSGACVYMVKDGQRIGIAIHAYGGATSNSGTRISTPVFANLEAWKKS